MHHNWTYIKIVCKMNGSQAFAFVCDEPQEFLKMNLRSCQLPGRMYKIFCLRQCMMCPGVCAGNVIGMEMS